MKPSPPSPLLLPPSICVRKFHPGRRSNTGSSRGGGGKRGRGAREILRHMRRLAATVPRIHCDNNASGGFLSMHRVKEPARSNVQLAEVAYRFAEASPPCRARFPRDELARAKRAAREENPLPPPSVSPQDRVFGDEVAASFQGVNIYLDQICTGSEYGIE